MTHIIKIGGSLLGSEALHFWLKQIQAQSHDETIILVPGGGIFADQIRKSQQQLAFTDDTAHHMAILAMTQFGLLLREWLPESYPLYYPRPIKPILKKGLYIWLPDKTVLTIEKLPHNWDITSDSMALWLAQSLLADKLSLIKVTDTSENDITKLSELNILDRGFKQLYQTQAVNSQLLFSPTHSSLSQPGLTLK